MDSSERSVKSEDLNDMDDVSDDEGDEELDPRIKVLREIILLNFSFASKITKTLLLAYAQQHQRLDEMSPV